MNTYPLSPFRKVGNLIFVSGQIGQQDGKLVSEDFRVQVVQIIQNIKNILEPNGLRLKDVVDVTVFLTDQNDYDALNEEYAKLFSEPYPARTTVTVKSLPLNAKIEIKAIAQTN